MKCSLLALLILASVFPKAVAAEDSVTLTSPNGDVVLHVETDGELKYSVSHKGAVLMEPSEIGMELLDGRKLGEKAALEKADTRKVDEKIDVPVPARRKEIRDHCSELTLRFKGDYSVIFRAYDDGVAYRFQTDFKEPITVKNELARFRLPADATVYYAAVVPRDKVDHFHTSFEESYTIKPLKEIPAEALIFSPTLVAPKNGPKVVVTESDLEDYPGMFLQAANGALQGVFAPYPAEEKKSDAEYAGLIVTKRADYIAKTNGKRTFPWRVMVIAEKDSELPNNDLVYKLAAPNRIGDTSWIKPGQSTEEWIIGIRLFNVPFKAGVNTASYKYYIDFAARFGLERIMMDAGWSDPLDLFKIKPELDMDEIARYAKEKGVGLSMWTLSYTLDRQLEPALKQFKKWGVTFIMTDFMDRDDQKMVQFYDRVARACAEAKLMVMFHGAYKSAGFERTYPNAITREGVLGSEFNLWTDKANPDHDLLIPFIRMVAGPMDYEPGLLKNASKSDFRTISGAVMSQGTRCHQLGMFLVYDSPLQMFSGNPSQGNTEPEFMEFLGSLPTVYDETKILDAKLGEYLVTARSKDSNWYIGGLTNWGGRELKVPLDFLNEGEYVLTLCQDGVNADQTARDYSISTKKVKKGDILTIPLASGGGFAVRLIKE